MDNNDEDRTSGIIARVFGSTVGSTVAGLMTSAAIVKGNPDAAMSGFAVGAATGVAAEEVAARALRWRAEGVERFAEAVEAEAGEPIEELIEAIRSDRKQRALLAEAVDTSGPTVDDWTIRQLAHVFVTGAKDPAKVDSMRLLARWLRGVEGPHARVLAVLGKKKPHRFTVDEVAQHDRALGHTAAILSRDLERLGLVLFLEWNVVGLSAEGWSCAALLDELGSLEFPLA